MEYTAHTREELYRVAGALLKDLSPNMDSATLITLTGELGAGKTTLAGEIAKQLGVYSPVQSPTFVIQKTYRVDDDHFDTLVHIDAYRLTGYDDLESLHFGETLQNSKNLIILEWPECVKGLKKADMAITITPEEGGSRTISYEAH